MIWRDESMLYYHPFAIMIEFAMKMSAVICHYDLRKAKAIYDICEESGCGERVSSTNGFSFYPLSHSFSSCDDAFVPLFSSRQSDEVVHEEKFEGKDRLIWS